MGGPVVLTSGNTTPERKFLGNRRASLRNRRHCHHSSRNLSSSHSLCSSSVRSLPLATVDETESSSSSQNNLLYHHNNNHALNQGHHIEEHHPLPATREAPSTNKQQPSIKMMLSTSLRNLYHLHAGQHKRRHGGGRPQEQHLHPEEGQQRAAEKASSSDSNSSSRRTVIVAEGGVTPPASPNPPSRPTVQMQPPPHHSIPSTAAGVRPPRFRLSKDRATTSASVPSMGIFHSNHVLVNKERAQYRLPPYKRCRELDDLARIHAKAMADERSVHHSVQSIDELRMKLHATHVAENVQCGESIRSMHDHVMAERAVSCHNLLGQFDEFGMATAKGTDGKLYLCQLFRR